MNETVQTRLARVRKAAEYREGGLTAPLRDALRDLADAVELVAAQAALFVDNPAPVPTPPSREAFRAQVWALLRHKPDVGADDLSEVDALMAAYDALVAERAAWERIAREEVNRTDEARRLAERERRTLARDAMLASSGEPLAAVCDRVGKLVWCAKEEGSRTFTVWAADAERLVAAVRAYESMTAMKSAEAR